LGSAERSDVFDLRALLSPIVAEEFLRHDYGQRFLHVPGRPGKFSALLPWPVLNKVLEEQRIEPPRLRLTRAGKPVPSEKWLSWQPNRRKSGSPIPRLNSTALTRELREGATLVLDNVDELHRPVRQMAEALERAFHVRVQVNSYSGFRTSHGFDLHWDDHDVFILQVAGRKQWKVYGMTRRFPLASDVESADAPPTQVLWEGLLEDGDLLYIPRGWWHVATPLDEPTLHLTVGVNNLTGADFLSWFVNRMKAAEVVREDLPHLAGAERLVQYGERLKAAVLEAWRPELVQEYLSHMDTTASGRPNVALPWSATPSIVPEGDFRVRWSGARAARVSADGEGTVSVEALGRRWRFATDARPLLEALVIGEEFGTEQLIAAAGLDARIVRALLRELAAEGLVAVR
jgi:hypothetical protein